MPRAASVSSSRLRRSRSSSGRSRYRSATGAESLQVVPIRPRPQAVRSNPGQEPDDAPGAVRAALASRGPLESVRLANGCRQQVQRQQVSERQTGAQPGGRGHGREQVVCDLPRIVGHLERSDAVVEVPGEGSARCGPEFGGHVERRAKSRIAAVELVRQFVGDRAEHPLVHHNGGVVQRRGDPQLKLDIRRAVDGAMRSLHVRRNRGCVIRRPEYDRVGEGERVAQSLNGSVREVAVFRHTRRNDRVGDLQQDRPGTAGDEHAVGRVSLDCPGRHGQSSQIGSKSSRF
jgi:hypothetical protein